MTLVSKFVGYLFVAATLGGAQAAIGVEQIDVDAACSDSRTALDAYETSQVAFSAVAVSLEATQTEIEVTRSRIERIDDLIDDRTRQANELAASVAAQTAELYMQAAAVPQVLELSSPEQILTAGFFLESTSIDALETADDLTTARADLERFQRDLTEITEQLADLEGRQQVEKEAQETAMNGAFEIYGQLDERCKEVRDAYRTELAAQAAAAAAPTIGPQPTGSAAGVRCPFDRGSTQFIDSWGFARSGGRGHEGADMMARWNEPIYAVESGTVVVETHGIGGKHIWLSGRSGAGYYYAHLNDFAVSDGQSVSKGDLVGYNGNSGNAAGGAPHVHFQIHPNGRGTRPINPYPILAPACL